MTSATSVTSKGSGPRKSSRTPVRAATAAALATIVLLAAACSSSSSSSDSTSAADPDATVRVGLVLEPSSLDIRTTSGVALDQVLIDNVYQGLVKQHSDGTVSPLLAEKYEVSPDGLTYTFTLREGVTFHDGAPLTAQDVVWSLDQLRTDPKLKGHDELAHVSSVAATGDRTVTLTLSSPDSNLLWSLSGRAGLVLEQAATNDRATTANGTGPYTVQSWKQGDSLTLVRNDGYWGDHAKVAEVVFRYIPDANAALNASLSGDLDVQTGVRATLASRFSGTDFTLVDGKTTDKFTLAFNNTKAPFTDIRVRQAIRRAIDPKALIAVNSGRGVALGGPIPEGDPGYEDLTSVDAYDPEGAKRLLAEAGQSDLALNLTVPNIYPTEVNDVLTSQLAQVGITVTVKPVEFTAWLQDVYRNKNFDLSLVDHAESRDFHNWANPQYYFGYDNPKVQALYEQSVAATDQSAADGYLEQAARLVSEDAAADWLFTSESVTAIAPGITGFPTDFTSARLDVTQLAAAGS